MKVNWSFALLTHFHYVLTKILNRWWSIFLIPTRSTPIFLSLSSPLFYAHTFHASCSSKTEFNSKSIFSAKLVFLWSYGVVCLLCYCRCSEILYVVLRVWTMLFLEYRETGVAYSLFRSCVYVCEFPISCLLLHTFVTLRFSDVQYFSMYAMHLFRVLTYGMSLYLL